ncbi:MAG: translocation/assembly module TamB domain-containing protein [Gallionella sp.]|nr:translocation/assembly module TamB domain-containing protein [Gallionella sp.]
MATLSRFKRWLLLAVVLALSSFGLWLTASTAGLKLMAATVTHLSRGSVTFTGVSGSLRGVMGAELLVVDIPDLRITVRDLRLDWDSLSAGRLVITSLSAREVDVLSQPSPFPASLRLPMALSVKKLTMGTLRVYSKPDSAADFSAVNLAARLESDGTLHRLEEMQARLSWGRLTASGQMNGARPFALQAKAGLAGLSGFTGINEAHIAASISGDLMALEIRLKGSGDKLAGSGQIRLAPYAPFPLTSMHLQLSGLDPAAFTPDAPHADLALLADLRGHSDGRIEGEVAAKNLSPAPLDHGGLPLVDAHTHVTLARDSLELDELRLTLGRDASISGGLSWHRQSATGKADLLISQLDPALLDTRLRAAKLGGSAQLGGDSQSQLAVLALSDGTRQLAARLTRTGKVLTLEQLSVTSNHASLTGEGRLVSDGLRPWRFSGQLQRFDLADFMSAPHSDLNATLDLSGFLQPSASGTVNFDLKASRLADQPVSGSGKIGFSGSRVLNSQAELRLGDNRLSVSGGMGLATDRLQLDLAAPKLAQLGHGYGGALTAHATLAGSLARPEVSFESEGQALVWPGEHRLDSLKASAGLHADALSIDVKAADYRVQGESKIQGMQLEVRGSRDQHELTARVQLDDESDLALQARGGLPDSIPDWTSVQWRGEISSFFGTGALPFSLQSASHLAISPQQILLDAANFSVAGGHVRINSLAWTPQRWHSQGSFTGIGLRAGAGLRPDLRDDRQALRLGGDWDIASLNDARVKVVRESGDWVFSGDEPVAMGLHTLELTAHVTHGQLAATLAAQGSRLGVWRGSISLPVLQSGAFLSVADHAPLKGLLRVDIPDLAWLGPAISDNFKSAGRLSLEAEVNGTVSDPGLRGHVSGDALALAFLDQGVRLQAGHLAARFDGLSLYIDTLSFMAPHDPKPKDSLLSAVALSQEAGRLDISGAIDLAARNGDLDIVARQLPLAQRSDRWIIASGTGHASLNKKVLKLAGTITADAGLIRQAATNRPQLSDDVVITGRVATVRKGPQIDATLNLGEHFYLRASGLEARLAGELSVRDVQGLRVTGSIAAREASFEAYGQQLSVERGIVNFQGALSDPGLNILAVRRGLSVEAGVAVTGTALHPVVKLVSTPAVPDVEKLSWIVLGRAPAATGTDSSLLLAAAGSILGGGTGGITGQLKQSLGVDELSLRQGENAGSSNGVADNPLSSQIVTVGKRLSSRAFLSYAQGVTAAAGVAKLTYTVTPRVNVVTQAGADNAIDVFYTFSFK